MKEELFKFRRILLTELTLVVFIGGLAILIYYSFNSPQSAASRWARAQTKADYNQMYEMMAWPDYSSEQISRKDFVTAQTLGSAAAGYDGKTVQKVREKTDSPEADEKIFAVTFKKDSQTFTEQVPLIKQGGLWLVNLADQYLFKDVQIEVPAGSTVKINKVKAKRELTENDKDIYRLEYAFAGRYYLEVEKSGYNKYQGLIDASKGEITVTPPYAKSELETVAQQAGNDLQSIVKGALSGLKGMEVKAFATLDSEELKSAYQQYDALCEELEDYDELTLTENKVKVSQVAAGDQDSGLQASITSQAADGSDSSWFSQDDEDEKTAVTNILTYKNTDDRWVLYSVDLDDAYSVTGGSEE